MVNSRSRKRQQSRRNQHKTPALHAKQYTIHYAIQTHVEVAVLKIEQVLKIEHPLSRRSVALLRTHLLTFYTLDPNVYNRTKVQKVRRQAYLTKREATDVLMRSLRLYRDTPLEGKPRIFTDVVSSSDTLPILSELHANCYRLTRRYLSISSDIYRCIWRYLLNCDERKYLSADIYTKTNAS